MIVFSHPTGNANVRATANGLAHAKLLYGFHTTIAAFPGSLLGRLGSFKGLSEIRRRQYDAALEPYTHLYPWQEVCRLAASRFGFAKLTEQEKGPFCIEAIYRNLDKKVAATLSAASNKERHVIYCYEDGALHSFRAAKRLGLLCFYDLPIGYWKAARRLLEVERQRWPEWAGTLTGFKDSENKLACKDEELRLADRIFVASRFTAETLKDFDGSLPPVEIIPYAFPPVYPGRDFTPVKHGPLKMLFVGSLSQRKGLANLLAVVEKLGRHVTLTILGRKVDKHCKPLDIALGKYRWIPAAPHDEILQLMREHDVLVFPSLFEGFGLVITEAMSQGTPVITTERTVGPDIIRNGENGWIVEAGSTRALQEAVEQLLLNRKQLASVGRAAMDTAALRPWDVYGTELAMLIKKQLQLT